MQARVLSIFDELVIALQQYNPKRSFKDNVLEVSCDLPNETYSASIIGAQILNAARMATKELGFSKITISPSKSLMSLKIYTTCHH